MKKTRIAIISILVVLVGFVLFIQNVNINRLGAQQYFVQINQDGQRVEDKLDNGEKYIYYEYTLKGFDPSGKEEELTFTAGKELRRDAYLRIYVKKDQVSSYQEVQAEELPEKAKQKLDSAAGK